jgi:hypothetical protein
MIFWKKKAPRCFRRAVYCDLNFTIDQDTPGDMGIIMTTTIIIIALRMVLYILLVAMWGAR